MRKILLLLMATLMITGCQGKVTQERPLPNKSTYQIKKLTNGKYHPIILLNNRCSAFVISDHVALTAGHCLKITKQFIEKQLPKLMKESIKMVRKAKEEIEQIKTFGCMAPHPTFCQQRIMFLKNEIKQELKARKLVSKADEFKVYDVNGEDTGIIAHAFSKNNDRRDYGFLEGDFSQFEKLKVKRDHGVKRKDVLRLCGFPGGKSPAVCVDYTSYGTDGFYMKGDSMVVPGSSGAPAINHNGEVVGIVSRYKGQWTLLTPTIGIIGNK